MQTPNYVVLNDWINYCRASTFLHQRSHDLYRTANDALVITSIVLSSLTGISSIGLGT